LKLQCDGPLSNVAFNFNLCRCTAAELRRLLPAEHLTGREEEDDVEEEEEETAGMSRSSSPPRHPPHGKSLFIGILVH
jgi:hypothetical protein